MQNAPAAVFLRYFHKRVRDDPKWSEYVINVLLKGEILVVDGNLVQ